MCILAFHICSTIACIHAGSDKHSNPSINKLSLIPDFESDLRLLIVIFLPTVITKSNLDYR